MTPDSFERELSRLFEAQRRADEASAPDLDALLARTEPRRRRPAGRRIAYAITIAGLVAAAVLLVRGDARRGVAPPAEAGQLADWQSPTAFLLETPGSELLTEIPTLAAQPTAETVSAPRPTKGVAR
jgi:hypothetical protein